IVAGLHAEIKFGRPAPQTDKPQRHLGRHRCGPVQHGIEGRGATPSCAERLRWSSSLCALREARASTHWDARLAVAEGRRTGYSRRFDVLGDVAVDDVSLLNGIFRDRPAVLGRPAIRK